MRVPGMHMCRSHHIADRSLRQVLELKLMLLDNSVSRKGMWFGQTSKKVIFAWDLTLEPSVGRQELSVPCLEVWPGMQASFLWESAEGRVGVKGAHGESTNNTGKVL